MKETFVIDDFIDKEFQDKIFNYVMAGKWNFLNDVSGENSKYPSYGFVQVFKHPNEGIKSNLYELICVPIINNLITKFDFKINDIHYTRSFLQLPLNDKYIKEHNGVHVDLPIDHLACIYYCNDSDGDTIIYEQNTENTPTGSNNVKLIEHRRVKPKKGRFVGFDGKRYHCSSQPNNNLRCIINFDLV